MSDPDSPTNLLICPDCRHDLLGHAVTGCLERDENGNRCTCVQDHP